MWGPALMVSPVIEQGVTSRQVSCPAKHFLTLVLFFVTMAYLQYEHEYLYIHTVRLCSVQPQICYCSITLFYCILLSYPFDRDEIRCKINKVIPT